MTDLGTSTLDDVASFGALLAAARRASRGKRNGEGMAALMFRVEAEVLEIERELQDRSYRPRPYRTFTVSDPKPRTISAAHPRDRVVHHALCAVLEPLFEAAAIPDSYACRPGKGSHAAVARARQFTRRYGYYLKMDVRKFFESASHEVLKTAIRVVVDDPGLLWLCDLFIDHGAPGSLPGRGLPIGNLTSQHFANFYLAPLDRLVTGSLRPGGYVRYMDDVLLFRGDKSALWLDARLIERFAGQDLALEMKAGATRLAPVGDGVSFLGFRIFPGCTRLDGRSRRRLIGRVRDFERSAGAAEPAEGCLDGLRSAFAHASHAGTLALRRSLIQNHLGGPGTSRARAG